MKNTILLIEDDDRLRRILQLVLQGAGYNVHSATDGQEGTAIWQQQPEIETVITDLQMPRMDGQAVLAFGQDFAPETPVIFLTAFGTVKTAVSAMKNGAFDYLTKPVDNNELLEIVSDALQSRHTPADDYKELIGSSSVMQNVQHDIKIFATTDSSVLISGESGTGKELAARAIHQASDHPEGPFVRVNCAAIPSELMESELFGHTKGAFTGAVSDRKGAFLKAEGGTLLLDEIGDLPLTLQPKLLHAVEEKTITPVGSGTAKTIKVKILSASNQDLSKMITEKTFRQDLYYRLNRVHLHMPPVRGREGDIEMLINHFLHQFRTQLNKYQLSLSQDSIELLNRYAWPGNVREIKNVVERAVLSCQGSEITPGHLPSSIRSSRSPDRDKTMGKSTDLTSQEKKLIFTALQDCNWNQSEASRTLGITRNTLRYRIKKHGISKA